jgi:hypothetical protein
MQLEFSRQIFENTSNFMKTSPVGAELFHVDGQTHNRTDITRPVVAFRSFGELAQKGAHSSYTLRTPL